MRLSREDTIAILEFSGEVAPLASERQAKTMAKSIICDRLCRRIGETKTYGELARRTFSRSRRQKSLRRTRRR